MEFLSNEEAVIIIRVIVAMILGLVIGIQRQLRKEKTKAYGIAGMRTHMLVTISTALISATGAIIFASDPARLAASILTGIGFIGASTVLATKNRILGLINATTIWVCAAIGITVGLGLFVPAAIISALSVVILELKRFEKIED